MKVAIPAETDPEPRVAATPDTVKKMKTLGADVAVQSGAGVKSAPMVASNSLSLARTLSGPIRSA